MASRRLYRVIHQNVNVRLDFDHEKIIGETTLSILPLQPKLSHINVNAQNLDIKSCTINNIDALYETELVAQHAVWHTDAWEGQSPGAASCRSLSLYRLLMHEEADVHMQGNIAIFLPGEVRQQIEDSAAQQQDNPESALKPFSLRINYTVAKPAAGLVFLTSPVKDKVALTYTSDGYEGNASSWLPCVDDGTERCTFTVAVTVPAKNHVVCSGSLKEVLVSSVEPSEKTWVFDVESAITPNYLGIAAGPFATHVSRTGVTSYYIAPKKGSKLLLKCMEHICGELSVMQNLCEDFCRDATRSFPEYSQVFIPDSFIQPAVWASFAVLSQDLLVSDRYIDATYTNRKIVARAMAQVQVFPTLIVESAADSWFPSGLCSYLVYLFVEKVFGRNEAHYQRYRDVESVLDRTDWLENVADRMASEGKEKKRKKPRADQMMEKAYERYSHIVAKPLNWSGYIRAVEVTRSDFASKKAFVVTYMLMHLLGRQSFRLLVKRVFQNSVDGFWRNDAAIPLSTKVLFAVANEISLEPGIKTFMDQWVRSEHIPKVSAKLSVNKGAHQIELKVRQKPTVFAGPLMFIIHEDNRSMQYIHRLDDLRGKQDFKFPVLSTGKRGKKTEGASIDSLLLYHTNMVKWVRLDRQGQWLRPIFIDVRRQEAYVFCYQLRHDQSVHAQLAAIRALHKQLLHFHDRIAGEGSTETDMHKRESVQKLIYLTLREVLNDPQTFVQVRIELIRVLAKMATRPQVGDQLNEILQTFIVDEYFERQENGGLVLKPNEFVLVANYHLKKAVPDVLSSLYGSDKYTLPRTTQLILTFLKQNDNQSSMFSDDEFVASLLRCLGNVRLSDTESIDTVYSELLRAFKYDQARPSFQNQIAQAALYASCSLEVSDQTCDRTDYFGFTQPGPLRDAFHPRLVLVAFECMVRLSIQKKHKDKYCPLLLQCLRQEPSVSVKHAFFQVWADHLVEHVTELSEFRHVDETNTVLLEGLWVFLNKEKTPAVKQCILSIIQSLFGVKQHHSSSAGQKIVATNLHAHYGPIVTQASKNSRTRRRIIKADSERRERAVHLEEVNNVMVIQKKLKDGPESFKISSSNVASSTLGGLV